MLMFEDLKRCLSVAVVGRLVQNAGHLYLSVCFALLCGEFHHGVKLRELSVFGGEHACGQCEGVAFEAQLGCVIDSLQTRFGRFDLARCKWNRMEHLFSCAFASGCEFTTKNKK